MTIGSCLCETVPCNATVVSAQDVKLFVADAQEAIGESRQPTPISTAGANSSHTRIFGRASPVGEQLNHGTGRGEQEVRQARTYCELAF